jgi:hypothetical protein
MGDHLVSSLKEEEQSMRIVMSIGVVNLWKQWFPFSAPLIDCILGTQSESGWNIPKETANLNDFTRV